MVITFWLSVMPAVPTFDPKMVVDNKDKKSLVTEGDIGKSWFRDAKGALHASGDLTYTM